MSAPTWGKPDDASEQRRRALALELAKGSGHTGPMSRYQDAAIGVDKIFAGIREMKARERENLVAKYTGEANGIPSGATTAVTPAKTPEKKNETTPVTGGKKLNDVSNVVTGKFEPGEPIKLADAPPADKLAPNITEAAPPAVTPAAPPAIAAPANATIMAPAAEEGGPPEATPIDAAPLASGLDIPGYPTDAPSFAPAKVSDAVEASPRQSAEVLGANKINGAVDRMFGIGGQKIAPSKLADAIDPPKDGTNLDASYSDDGGAPNNAYRRNMAFGRGTPISPDVVQARTPIDQNGAQSVDEAGMRLADAIDPPKKEDNQLSGGMPGGNLDPRLDAFSPQNALRSQMQDTKEKPQSMDRGRYPQYADTIQKIGEERGWQTFNPASVGQLLRGESGGRNLPPNKFGYTGYFQMRPSDFTKEGQFLLNANKYGGPRMTPQDFANMSFDDQAKLYADRLSKYEYDGTQNLGVMNAAPAYKNAGDSTVAYRAGSREAAANPAWVRASDAGGAVTVGGIKNWHNGGREAPSVQTASITPVQQADTGGLTGGDMQPWRVASLGGDMPMPRQQQAAPPPESAAVRDGLGLSQQVASSEPPVQTAQNAGALNMPQSMFSPTPMNQPQQQKVAPQQQNVAPQQQPVPYGDKDALIAQKATQQAKEAQDQMSHWARVYNDPSSSPDIKMWAAQNYGTAKQALDTATMPVSETKTEQGRTTQIIKYPDGRVVSRDVSSPEQRHDKTMTPDLYLTEAENKYRRDRGLPERSPADIKHQASRTGENQNEINIANTQKELYTSAIQARDTASQFNNDIKTFMALQNEVKSGPFSREMQAKYGAQLIAMGFKPEEIGKIQGMDSITARLGPKMRAAGSGATSDWEGMQFIKGLPSIGKSNEGNAIVASTVTALNDLATKRGQLAAYAYENRIPLSQWQQMDDKLAKSSDPLAGWRNWARANGTYVADPSQPQTTSTNVPWRFK